MAGNFLINPVDFLNRNLVIPDHLSFGSSQDSAGVRTMCLWPNGTAIKNGQPIDRWKVIAHSPKYPQAKIEAIFNGYWLPYDQNHTFTCMLGADADYMFTATMNGCSFGIGSQPGDGSCLVGHANKGTYGAQAEAQYGLPTARRLQAASQTNMLISKIPALDRVINGADYQDDGAGAMTLQSTTFGVRRNNTWHFSTQKYRKVDAATFIWMDVTAQ